ncbi:MAG: S-layer homology domain-containing protein [Clostridia bacterium]|nr:S-layer homology domain-containing protein [Clostridia bacterium]
MRKFVSVLLASLLCIALMPYAAFAAEFSDLSAEHWAYQNVQALVAEGTISGFEDGSFRPNNIVTRAQFVKMIGKGPDRYTKNFSDVSASHWAYEYVMQSGLVSENATSFLPDQAIKRSEVIELLWKRAGSKTGYSAPGIVTLQASNKDAVAWAYSCGIVNGDDGIHLRLGDTMSRAEGAALIIRSREKAAAGASQSFVNVVNNDILKYAYSALDLFDSETYEANKNVTFGELARATVRIAGGEYNPSYYSLNSTTPFEHKYARDLDVLGRNVIGTDKVTKEVIDTTATIGDAIAAFTFAAIYRSPKPIAAISKTDAFGDMAETKNRMITYSINNGVLIDKDNSLTSLNRAATVKDVIAIAIQIDSFLGMQSDYSTDTNAIGNERYAHSLDLSRRSYNNFKFALKNIPNEVYTTEFTSFGEKASLPKDSYRFVQAYESVFASSLTQYASMLKELKDFDCTIVFYPSLTTDNGNGYTMRAKITPNNLPAGSSIASYFNCSDKVGTYTLSAGKSFYADIASGEPLTSVSMDVEKIFIDKVICD